MNIENSLAYSFFFTDDVFLTAQDRQALTEAATLAIPPQVILQTTDPVFQYRGANKKAYLVISHYPDHDFMADAHLAALEATLKRLGIQSDDTAIFNYAKYPNSALKEITAFFKPEKILILGNRALPEDMQVASPNKPGQVGDIRTLFTFSFAEMMDNTENKKAFWEAIKQF